MLQRRHRRLRDRVVLNTPARKDKPHPQQLRAVPHVRLSIEPAAAALAAYLKGDKARAIIRSYGYEF